MFIIKEESMKKVLLITIMCVFMVVGCNKTENVGKKPIPTTDVGKVVDIFAINITAPSFSVGTAGLYDGGFNNESLKNVKIYDIKAVMNDGYEEETHSYKGYKVKEILSALEIDSYEKLEFSSNGGLNVTFYLNEVDDNMFLFFERDGIRLENAPINLLVPTQPARYSIQNVQTLTIS